MHRRLAALLAAFAIAVTGLSSAPSPVAAAGACGAANRNDQAFVRKDIRDAGGASYFTGVRGDANVIKLDVCLTANQDTTNDSAFYGGTFVLAANIQGPNGIAQLGYGQAAGQTIRRFWYTPNNDGSAYWWPTGFAPILGHRYTFTITRVNVAGIYRARFTITHQSDGYSESRDSGLFWPGNMDTTWYGVERLDGASSLGNPASNGTNINFANMGYTTSAQSVWTYRSGMTIHSTGPVSGLCDVCEAPSFANVTESIGDWTFGGDRFNVTDTDH